jgi:hypothetical protein|tara:strand:- start:199 stop:345 length:147 start_codon:yes stop_codon:yes gene_type:complete
MDIPGKHWCAIREIFKSSIQKERPPTPPTTINLQSIDLKDNIYHRIKK